MLEIQTISLYHKNPPGKVLDVTVQTGLRSLAPEWMWVVDYRGGLMTEERFTELYMAKIRASAAKHNRSTVWDFLFNEQHVILGCYCRAGNFCHRVLLAEFLVELARQHCIEAEYIGEYV